MVKLKVLSQGGTLIWDFRAGRITALCFHALCREVLPHFFPLAPALELNLPLQYNISKQHLLTPLSAPLPSLVLYDLLQSVFKKGNPLTLFSTSGRYYVFVTIP